MDDPDLLSLREANADTPNYALGVREGEGGSRDHLGEGLPLNGLHDDIEAPIGGLPAIARKCAAR
jgi:hypothetical protein